MTALHSPSGEIVPLDMLRTAARLRPADPAHVERLATALDDTDRLGGELLIPFKAALAAARRSWSDEQVAVAFDVSLPYARMRMNLSGARKVADRQRALRRRA
jgi:hypothetical protein